MMNERQRMELRNAAIVAFINAVAVTVAVEDETGTGKVTVEDILEDLRPSTED